MSVKTEVDFKWLEEKTSPEMVEAVRKVVERSDEDPVLNVHQQENIIKTCNIHSIELYITTDFSCHYFNYNVKHGYLIHDKILRFVVKNFAKMEKKRIEQLSHAKG